MSELKKIGAELAQKLGINVSFYTENMRLEGGPVCDKPFETVTDDGQYTYFRFLYKGIGYIGVLEGAGEEQKRYAMLLPSYIENFTERETELSKTAQLKRILLGESSSMSIYKYTMKYSVRLFNEDGTPTARTGKILGSTPQKRFGEVSDLLGTLLWLANDDASGFVTGVVVPVDGGFNAYSGV